MDGRGEPLRRADVVPLAIMHDRVQAARLLGTVEKPDEREDAIPHAVEEPAMQQLNSGEKVRGYLAFAATARLC